MSYQNIEEYFTQFPDDVETITIHCKTDHLPDLSRFCKLKKLKCCNNELTSLPPLPSTLIELCCFYNQITYLPPLPSTLEYLYCTKNQLTSLPLLPSTLKGLCCNNNQLTSLPPLPSVLKSLYCYRNQLACLPPLPSTLELLHCDSNKLTHLPPLPSTLKTLVCNSNQFTRLPPLPSSLQLLNCAINQLTCLPLLPSALEIFYFNNNPILDYYIKPDASLFMVDYMTKLRNQIEIINQFRELFHALKCKKQFIKWLWHIREPKIRNRYHPNNLMALLEGKEESTLDELDELLEKW